MSLRLWHILASNMFHVAISRYFRWFIKGILYFPEQGQEWIASFKVFSWFWSLETCFDWNHEVILIQLKSLTLKYLNLQPFWILKYFASRLMLLFKVDWMVEVVRKWIFEEIFFSIPGVWFLQPTIMKLSPYQRLTFKWMNLLILRNNNLMYFAIGNSFRRVQKEVRVERCFLFNLSQGSLDVFTSFFVPYFCHGRRFLIFVFWMLNGILRSFSFRSWWLNNGW